MSGCSKHRQRLSRRDFLRGAGLAAAGVLAGGCGAKEPPAAPPGDALPTSTPAPTATAAAEATAARPQVAIATARDYDRQTIYKQVRDLLDAIGGLGDVVHSGDRVAIKVNLTGGTGSKPLPGYAPIDSYITHPEVVRALGGLVRDAGARQVYIVEAAYEWASFVDWGYEEVAQAIDAELINLNDTAPYSDFAQTPVPGAGFIYPQLTFNHLLEEVDAFISVPKIKCHYCCGVTHSLKNLVGLVPARFYRLNEQHNHRSAFHGPDEEMGTRLPRVVVDLNRARPVHLALLDGIKTTEGGEGPWIASMAYVHMGVLMAGKDPVATDAVATAAMGYDPTARRDQGPFLRADNHLNIAAEMGLGTNRLDEIEILGPSIDDVKVRFAPATG
jgi:uncharacterized protein (DUF362 family)